jgi:hypothetical protein
VNQTAENNVFGSGMGVRFRSSLGTGAAAIGLMKQGLEIKLQVKLIYGNKHLHLG